MTGWLVYERGNTERNAFFIERWMQAASRKGIKLVTVLLDEVLYGVQDDMLFLKLLLQDTRPDFVVMRAQEPLLSLHLERMGIPCHNDARVAAICNDKRATHQLFAGRLPMMDTAFVSLDRPAQPYPWPAVVKAAHGCGGRQVILAQDEEQYMAALRAFAPDEAVVQPVCDEPGKDLRVYVLGNQVVGAMLRHQEGDFRSNVGLGGGSHPVEMTDDIKFYVDLVLKEFSFGLAGIDFIFRQGKAVFNEIEDAVGTRMLYMHTDRDIASEYLDHIVSGL